MKFKFLLILVSMLLLILTLGFKTSYKELDVCLYCINENQMLEYNVTERRSISENAGIIGYGIDSIDDLKKILGSADAPDPCVGIQNDNRKIGKRVIADLSLNEDGLIEHIRITSIDDRPIIGFSWKSDKIDKTYLKYAEAFERNGAQVVFLPKVTCPEEAITNLYNIDGIFMSGGPDWNPLMYGQIQTPHGSGKPNNDRDISDIHYIQQAINNDLPLLAICRGAQGLNIALGGSLIQDIPLYLGQKVLDGEIPSDRVSKVLSGSLPDSALFVQDTGYILYDEQHIKIGDTFNGSNYLYDVGCDEGHLRVEVDGIGHTKDSTVHAVNICKDSKWLYSIFKDEKIELVSTNHHQAIDPNSLGAGLSVAAYSPDGLIEAIEYKSNSFVLGLLWHPEKDALGDSTDIDMNQDLSNAPIRVFVNNAASYKAESSTG